MLIPEYNPSYCCPRCGSLADGDSLVSKTEEIFVCDKADPYYEWEEVHKCTVCGLEYKIINGS